MAEPLEDCLAVDAHGRPCLEVMTPVDLETELGMPGGHIFHGDLSWPWLDDDAVAGDAGRALGRGDRPRPDPDVRSGRPRGGAVSGLGGHNAAMAVLDRG